MLTKKTKTLILGSTALIAGAGITTAIAIPASQTSPFEVQYFESGAAIASLNHVVRADTAMSPVYGFFMEGILSTSHPQALETLANKYQKIGYKNYVPYTIETKTVTAAEQPPIKAKYMTFASEQFNDESSFDSKTGDTTIASNGDSFTTLEGLDGSLYAPGVTDILEVNEQAGKAMSFRARVNPDAGWSNGDKILASDFVATIKYMLDTKTASLGSQVLYETLQMRGAKEITTMQTKDDDINHPTFGAGNYYGKKKSFEEAWDFAKNHKSIGLPVTTEGTDNRWVHYFFEKGQSFSSTIPYLGGAQFMPVDDSFVKSVGGILKYGQTKETILSDGPYKISSMDLDYMITFSKNEHYYEPEMVLMDHPGYKIAPSTAISLKLFEDGKLSNMDVPNEFLASIYKKPSLIPMLNHGGTIPATSGLKFSKFYSDTIDKNSPTGDKNFRKAIMYAIDRNRYASYTNQSGSSPANALFAPRSKTAVSDENGNDYYSDMINAHYKEYDPITGTADNENLGFDGYDSASKYRAAYDSQLNHEYKDYLYNKKLANDYIDAYLKSVGKTSVDFKVDIYASQENSFLSLQNLFEETFGNKVNISSHLISTQIWQDEVQNGEYESIFGSISTSVDDPWTLYSQVIIEDGYKDSKNHIPYPQTDTKNSMLVTSRYWTIPGFNIQNAINDVNNNVGGEKKDDALKRMDISPEEWKQFQKAVTEAQAKHESSTVNQSPAYKYGVATQMSKVTSETIKGFTLPDEDEAKADGKTFDQAAYDKTVNLLTPYIRKDGTQSPDKIFKKQSSLFDFYVDVEKLMRDSSWFVPTLTSTSGWFIERRGYRGTGNQEGMPYGYRNIYPRDNKQLIASIEATIKEKYDVDIELDEVE